MTLDRDLETRRVGLARHLRRSSTDAERRLWHVLRDRRMLGRKFRRQHPVGRYVVDFICEDEKLIVEVDGSQHSAAGDAVRTKYLEDIGFRVIRFWNNEVLQSIDAVARTTEGTLAFDPRQNGDRVTPSPQPSPQGEGV